MVVASFLVVIALIAAGAWWLLSVTSDDGPGLGKFGPQEQREKAEELVAGLNTGDVGKVPVARDSWSAEAETAQNRTIEAAMPSPGCRYTLISVVDRGEQGVERVPGATSETRTYRFDMVVDEQCPTQQPRQRTIGVIAAANMGYWNPMAFVT
ncbi:hypothetical protein [Mycobacterium hubeiense]|uniref:hypothetical protein n=1 Tax=Mycobacterium hubeiense TaxID=1867256 RepID=UPI001157EFE0|nr:hypothetical protein [Mycobacterium sp. QGD 101]